MAKRLLFLIVLLVWTRTTIFAQQAEDLQKQLEQLKQEYQKKIEDLEQRIAALEKKGSQGSVSPQAAPQQSKSQGVTSAVGTGIEQGV